MRAYVFKMCLRLEYNPVLRRRVRVGLQWLAVLREKNKSDRRWGKLL